MAKIKDIIARQIFDSRGNPTVEVDVITENLITGRAAVPSGASTGEHEAVELRDGGSDYHGKGVLNAVSNINNIISKELVGRSVFDQILNDNQDKVTEYKSGKDKLFGFFVGQAMKVSGGKANPKLLNEISYQI